jgi:hypothetical protein
MERELAAFRALSRARGVLRIFGKTGAKIASELDKIPGLAAQFEQLGSAPDRFNKHYLPRGWLYFERLNSDVANSAISLAEHGSLEEGEKWLLNHFSHETVRLHLKAMSAVQACRPRMKLLGLAATDYEEERYHACVPVVLAQIDGLVRDLDEEFFDKKGARNLVAYDSVSAHPEALPALAKVLSKHQGTTVDSPIEIPYRHGILHGRELGYASRITAAKSWVALFSLRDWATRAEQGRLGPPPPKPEPSWRDLLQQLREIEQEKRATNRRS